METNDITQAELAVAKALKNLNAHTAKNRLTTNRSNRDKVEARSSQLSEIWVQAEATLFNLINK